ncbi:MAG: YitT family protein [Agathobacter sp.]|nr:YitT family protein [Agathobacter sp.]
MKQTLKKNAMRILTICIAALVMAINIKTFVQTGNLIPGGATGLTILIQRAFEHFFQLHIPYTLLNLSINAVPVYIGFRFIGKKFTMYSCLMIFLTSIFTDLIPSHVVTYDILLISIFGGIINGFAISQCLRVDATTGGTDFISIYLSQKTGTDSFNIVLIVNIVIIGLGGILFGWDIALYSIIFQYASTQMLHMLYKQFQQQTLFIVTNHATEVCAAISEVSNHGATIMKGEGSYQGHERSVVYSVVSTHESQRVISAIKEVDEHAFINTIKTEHVKGRFYHKPKD